MSDVLVVAESDFVIVEVTPNEVVVDSTDSQVAVVTDDSTVLALAVGRDVTLQVDETNVTAETILIPPSEVIEVLAAGPMGPGGPEGPEGDIGPIGPTGPQGVIGPVGPQGATGATGATGGSGPTGPQGEVGPVGPAGLVFRGIWSAVETYNENDAVAYAGLNGRTSTYVALQDGLIGTAPEIDGDPPTAASGWGFLALEGARGPMGPQGEVGATGAQGATGATGPQGATGAIGATGPQGPNNVFIQPTVPDTDLDVYMWVDSDAIPPTLWVTVA